jgi:hypothetical protein
MQFMPGYFTGSKPARFLPQKRLSLQKRGFWLQVILEIERKIT